MADVVWQRTAFDAMDAVIRENRGRIDEIATALGELDLALRSDPFGAGESRNRPYRVATSGPLTLHFRPARGGQLVYVVRVRFRASRRPGGG